VNLVVVRMAVLQEKSQSVVPAVNKNWQETSQIR